ncbi:hypothetical protein QCD79_35110, partial [Pseudomonas quasicaspiana]|nr:hypothetical protein [Pseudomonas quasicaspiana]
ALAHIHFHFAAGFPGSAGGVLGEILGDMAKKALNIQGLLGHVTENLAQHTTCRARETCRKMEVNMRQR